MRLRSKVSSSRPRLSRGLAQDSFAREGAVFRRVSALAARGSERSAQMARLRA